MNNLGYLRKDVNLTYRSLEKKIGIDRTTLNLLELGKQKLTEARINVFCAFYKVSSDFLLGKTEYGLLIEYYNGRGFTTINKKDYEIYKDNNLIIIVVQTDGVHRIAVKELTDKLDPMMTKDIMDSIEEKIKNMSRKDLEKVDKFIDLINEE